MGKSATKELGKLGNEGAYLLYGPSGTGKSSLIAAMANYLTFDIYDLDLTDIHPNSQLKSLLLSMSGRSKILIALLSWKIGIPSLNHGIMATVSLVQL